MAAIKADVVLAVPKGIRSIRYEQAERSVQAVTSFEQSQKRTVGLSQRYGSVIAIIRNFMVKDAFAFNSDWLMFIDDDIIVPNDIISKLMAHDKDIVGALAVRKESPFNPVAYEKKIGEYKFIETLPENQLVEVDAVGFGAVLIKTEVFRKVKKPWFANPAYGETVLGEDIFFCKHAKEAGFSVYVDTSMQVAHLGDYPYTYEDYLAVKKAQNGSSGIILPNKKIEVVR